MSIFVSNYTWYAIYFSDNVLIAYVILGLVCINLLCASEGMIAVYCATIHKFPVAVPYKLHAGSTSQ